MKALIMAAGYATRLYPLTKDRAKPLLPIAGKPIIGYIADALDRVREIDRIYVVTNSRFAASFNEWASARRGRAPVTVVDDGTCSDADKLGAIGDIRFVLDHERVNDDLFIVLGDNLFDLDLATIMPAFRAKGTIVAAYDIGDRKAAGRFGILGVDAQSRVIDFQEKPTNTSSTLVALGMYLFPREKIPLFSVYMKEGNNRDAPGYYIRWLYRREAVYAHVFRGVWYDIGDIEMYRSADALYRAKGDRGKSG
ncbi:MAG: nucleotidyltransferase family protein [Candidatus Aureabacteria bacterium]|nr:nucleotidyltransferase family protein [Candidatus Auribacterota bacterium]